VDFYLKRHPIGLPPKTVREVLDELMTQKTSRQERAILKDLRQRPWPFADELPIRIATITADRSRTSFAPGVAERTQNNFASSSTPCSACHQARLPAQDHDEMNAVERADNDSGEIEISIPRTPQTIQCLFDRQCKSAVRGATARPMIPYLAIARILWTTCR